VWKTLVSSVSSSSEMEIEDEVVLFIFPLKKLEKKERKLELWMHSLLN
jgi:hypothetical protein